MKTKNPKSTSGNLLLLSILLIVFCLISDFLIAEQPLFPKTFWGLYDGFVHGTVGVLVLLPLLKKIKFKFILLFFLSESLIDIDHFVAAHSWSITEVMLLPMRPITHSVTFAILLGIIASLLFKNRLLAFWIIFAAVCSHVVRDASSGVTPIFYPLEIYRIPVWTYYLFEVVLLYTSYIIGSKTSKNKGTPSFFLK